MSPSQRIVAIAVVLATPVAAQGRIVNLTGRPVAALAPPFTQISGIRELPGNRAVVVDAGVFCGCADFTRRRNLARDQRVTSPARTSRTRPSYRAEFASSWTV